MGTLSSLFCEIFGDTTTNVFISVLCGAAVMLYFTHLALNSGSANVSGAIKLFVVISALTSLASIVNAIFGFTTLSC